MKSVNIEFIVDKTAPTYTLTGVDKNNENYIGSKNAVLMPKDDGGKLGHTRTASGTSMTRRRDISTST